MGKSLCPRCNRLPPKGYVRCPCRKAKATSVATVAPAKPPPRCRLCNIVVQGNARLCAECREGIAQAKKAKGQRASRVEVDVEQEKRAEALMKLASEGRPLFSGVRR